MFNNVRWRIALWFVGLSASAYIVPTALALMMFYVNMTNAIDAELTAFLASFGHAINVVDGKPVLRDWAREVQTKPAHSLITYQLFDRQGQLLEAHFPPGIAQLFKIEHEVTANGLTMRTRMTELREGSQVVGYLQTQLPTRSRDEAVTQLALIMAVVAPVVLAGLSWSAYLVSEKATAQTRQTLAMLRRFVADASHELYTPLSIVQAANESLSKVVSQAGIGANEFEISESALERMEKMLEDLMLLSTVDAPSQLPRRASVDIPSLLQKIVQEFQPKFDKKGVQIVCSIGQGGTVRGDAGELRRMFENIIENALRYTDSGGRVSVEQKKDGHTVRVQISDTGIGIPEECLKDIFDRFYRVDVSRSRESGGSGLGLSIAQAIAQSHDGTITALSEPGSGSTFKVTLPLQES